MKGRKRAEEGRNLLPQFLGSMRGLRQDGYRLPTSTSIEKAFTEGPLAQRSDLIVPELGGIVYLRSVGEHLGIPEYTREADIWLETLISKNRMGRIELTETLKAKVEKEYELARIEAKKEEVQRGRERGT